jgi:hypothetical protein
MALSTDTIPYIVFGSLAVIFGVPIFILSLGKCQPKWLKRRLSRNRKLLRLFHSFFRLLTWYICILDPDKARHATIPKGSQASAESAEIQLEEGLFEYHYMSSESLHGKS